MEFKFQTDGPVYESDLISVVTSTLEARDWNKLILQISGTKASIADLHKERSGNSAYLDNGAEVILEIPEELHSLASLLRARIAGILGTVDTTHRS